MRSSKLRGCWFAVAVSAALLTSGCQVVGAYQNAFATLFGRPQWSAVPVRLPPPSLVADRIVVLKSRRLLELVRDDRVVKTFPIALGLHGHGPKERAGDGRTPEGDYVIDWRSENTRYTRELHISYPSAADLQRARARHVQPGGAIFIHGMPRDFGPDDPPQWVRDWTEGCVAVGNTAIKTIWDAVPNGTPIEILP